MKKTKGATLCEGREPYIIPVVEIISVRVESGFAESDHTNKFGRPGDDGTLPGNNLGDF